MLQRPAEAQWRPACCRPRARFGTEPSELVVLDAVSLSAVGIPGLRLCLGVLQCVLQVLPGIVLVHILPQRSKHMQA